MQYQYDESLLRKLIEKSFSLTRAQKAFLLGNFEKIPEWKKHKTYEILAEEQLSRYKLIKRMMAVNNEYATKSQQNVNQYNEALTTINENSVLKELDADLADAFLGNAEDAGDTINVLST